MNKKIRYERTRLAPEARNRVLARIARLDHPDVSEIETTTEALRDILREEPVYDTPAAMSAPVVHRQTEGVPTDKWDTLRTLDLMPNTLDRNLVITAKRTDPAAASFDVLRARLFKKMTENNWKRVAITSPTKGCGKSFTAINLAITLSRYDNSRTVLLDMDMRHPALAKYVGAKSVGSLGDMFRGKTRIEDHFLRVGDNDINIGKNLAVALNDTSEPYAAELFLQPKTKEVLTHMEQALRPDIIVYDLPPALAQDDVLAFRPFFDCVLMVVGGGISNAKDIKEVNRRLGEDTPIVGVVLNMSEDVEDNTY